MYFNPINADENSSNLEGASSPTTPKKRGRKATLKNDAKEINANIQVENSDVESPAKKRNIGKAKKTTVPTSLEEASEEDKLIMEMKDNGKSWGEIATAWSTLTGKEANMNGLKKRLQRLKASLITIPKDHEILMLACEKEVDIKLQTEKWQMLSAALEAKCGTKYPPAALQKRIKDLAKKGFSVDHM